MGKRLISVLLFAVLLVGLLPAHAGAADGGNLTPTMTWSLDENVDGGAEYTLTISGTGAMPDFTHDRETDTADTPWWEQKDNITAIVIDKGVTTIGELAFYYCRNLTSVTIPKGVTTIGDSAFDCCYALTSVDIPSGVTTIEPSAFSSCENLTSVAIPSSVTTIGDRAFYECISLTSVTIPSGVTSIGTEAFYDCKSLATVTFLGETPPEIGEQCFSIFDMLSGPSEHPSNPSIKKVSVPEGTESDYAILNDKGIDLDNNATLTPLLHGRIFAKWGHWVHSAHRAGSTPKHNYPACQHRLHRTDGE